MPELAGGADPLLSLECRIFTRYLASQEPSDYIREHYARCHALIPCRDASSVDAVDRMLLHAARRGPIATRIADAYARFARPNGALRQKLVLMLAVLENSPETHTRFDTASTGGIFQAGLVVVAAGVAGAASLAAGVLLLGPLHLFARSDGEEGSAP